MSDPIDKPAPEPAAPQPVTPMTKDEVLQSDIAHTLTTSQLDDSWAIAGVIAGAIHKSGAFKDKLGDYAHAFARSEAFSPVKGEMIIRDVFKARFGQTMNDLRQTLKDRAEQLGPDAKTDALKQARQTEAMIRDGQTMPFYKAFDQTGGELASRLGVTELAAKKLMSDAYQDAEGRELYASCKELEAAHRDARDQANQTQDRPADWPVRSQGEARAPARTR